MMKQSSYIEAQLYDSQTETYRQVKKIDECELASQKTTPVLAS